MKVGYKALIAQAQQSVSALTPDRLQEALEAGACVAIDVRDIREIQREGGIPGAFHCPRGLLEFWIDPESPYFKPIFAGDKPFVFYCAMGWRSVLSAQTAQTMGLENVSHLEGGFEAWKASGAPIDYKPAKP